MKKKFGMLCGCYVDKTGIVFCRFHSNVQAFANELNFLAHLGGAS